MALQMKMKFQEGCSHKGAAKRARDKGAGPKGRETKGNRLNSSSTGNDHSCLQGKCQVSTVPAGQLLSAQLLPQILRQVKKAAENLSINDFMQLKRFRPYYTERTAQANRQGFLTVS